MGAALAAMGTTLLSPQGWVCLRGGCTSSERDPASPQGWGCVCVCTGNDGGDLNIPPGLGLALGRDAPAARGTLCPPRAGRGGDAPAARTLHPHPRLSWMCLGGRFGNEGDPPASSWDWLGGGCSSSGGGPCIPAGSGARAGAKQAAAAGAQLPVPAGFMAPASHLAPHPKDAGGSLPQQGPQWDPPCRGMERCGSKQRLGRGGETTKQQCWRGAGGGCRFL